jgi:PAS domain S-box-containing protein
MSELRKTGIEVLGEIPWGSHFCAFYETKQDLLDTIIPFFKAGLESKEFCLWVVPTSGLINKEDAEEALQQSIPGFREHIMNGNMEVIDGLEWYLEKKIFNIERVTNELNLVNDRTGNLGFTGMRASGDTSWLTDRYRKDFLVYEQQLSDFINSMNVTILCTYPLSLTAGAEILDVVRTHQFAIARRKGQWEVIETPELIQAKAEIQKLNKDLEQKVIERTRQLQSANTELKNEVGERKKAEDALRQNEDRIRQFINAIPTMAWSIQPDGTVDFLNQRWTDYSGLSLEQFIEDPMAPIHPDDGRRVVAKWLTNKAAGQSFEDEMRLRRADGEYRWFLVRTEAVHDRNGNTVKWYGVSIDIEDNKQAKEKLKKTTHQLRELSDHLQNVREEERTHIAREIHDELGGQLTVLKMDASWLNKKLPAADKTVKEKVGNLIDVLDAMVKSVRRISTELRPSLLDKIGLAATMEWHLKDFEKRSGIETTFTQPEEELKIPDAVKNGLFRIFQESLTNVARHSKASHVKVELQQDNDNIILSIVDDGKGFEKEKIAEKTTLGILGMKERTSMMGGSYEITSKPEKGTKVNVVLPCKQNHLKI